MITIERAHLVKVNSLYSKMPPSELSLAIASDQWEHASSLVQPRQARHWSVRQGFFEGLKDSNVLPLHEVVVAEEAPYSLVLQLFEAYPDAVYCKESSYDRLPLHCACRRNADVSVIQLLLDANREACLVPDRLGRLPLHYALSNGANVAVVELLLKYHPAAARGVDARGWTPLHVACSMGADTGIIVKLLHLYPEAIIIRTKKGCSPARCLNKHCSHRPELKEVLIHAKQQFDETFVSPLNSSHHRTLDDMVIV